MKKVAIIGAGISGLAAAYTIEEARRDGAEIDYLVLEKSNRVGGKIATIRTKDGYVIEGGPDCFVSTKPWVFELSRKLDCEDKLIGSNDEFKKTYILVKKKLREMPDGIMMMVPTKILPFITTSLFSWPGKIRMGLDLFIPKKKEAGDETLASFVNRRLGPEALDRIAEPLVAGIHASDPATMSLAATFPNFLEMEQKYGSVIKGMLAGKKAQDAAKKAAKASSSSKPKRTFFMTFKGGMLDLVDEVTNALDKDKILLEAEVKSIEETAASKDAPCYRLHLLNGSSIEADAVIIASPADHAGDITDSLDADLSRTLKEIPQISSATVTIAFHKKDIKHDLKGFGFVIPHSEGRKIMATTWSSTKWSYRVPDDEHVIIRAFVGGAKSQEQALKPDDEIVASVRKELRELMGIDAEPAHVWLYRWVNGMPQYTIGHLERVEKIEERVSAHPGLFIAGGSYKGVGVPDCINSGNKAAHGAIQFIKNQVIKISLPS